MKQDKIKPGEKMKYFVIHSNGITEWIEVRTTLKITDDAFTVFALGYLTASRGRGIVNVVSEDEYLTKAGVVSEYERALIAETSQVILTSRPNRSGPASRFRSISFRI